MNIIAVVTQPDKPRGRSQKLSFSPVKMKAKELLPHLPVFQPAKASDPAFIQAIRELKPDLFVVVGYGQILKKDLLDIPKSLPINIHTSLLPEYRGAAPMQRALMDGVKKTGVTIMEMDVGMDTGDILAQREIAVPNSMTLQELEEKMIQAGSDELLRVVEGKGFKGKAQNHPKATYAKKLDPKEFEISWEFPASVIHNHVRSISPKPGAWCSIKVGGEPKRLKILRSNVVEMKGAPSEILVQDKRLIIGSAKDALEILELQLEGKGKSDAKSFLNGFRGKFIF